MAVSVRTAEYIIRRTVRIPSHLFMGNSHFPISGTSPNMYKAAVVLRWWHKEMAHVDNGSHGDKPLLLPGASIAVEANDHK